VVEVGLKRIGPVRGQVKNPLGTYAGTKFPERHSIFQVRSVNLHRLLDTFYAPRIVLLSDQKMNLVAVLDQTASQIGSNESCSACQNYSFHDRVRLGMLPSQYAGLPHLSAAGLSASVGSCQICDSMAKRIRLVENWSNYIMGKIPAEKEHRL